MQLDDELADHGLVIDPVLLTAWEALRLKDVQLLGLAGEISEDSTRASVVLVTDRPLAEAAGRYLQGQLDDVLETPTELVALNDAGGDLPRLLKQWIHLAAQGAGRGVQLVISVPDDAEPIQVSVSALDSSARELTMRLGGRPVHVLDTEAVN
jgi:hypothetical protein